MFFSFLNPSISKISSIDLSSKSSSPIKDSDLFGVVDARTQIKHHSSTKTPLPTLRNAVTSSPIPNQRLRKPHTIDSTISANKVLIQRFKNALHKNQAAQIAPIQETSLLAQLQTQQKKSKSAKIVPTQELSLLDQLKSMQKHSKLTIKPDIK